MPEEIQALQERAAGGDEQTRRQSIANRLAAHKTLYEISRYRVLRAPTDPHTTSQTAGQSPPTPPVSDSQPKLDALKEVGVDVLAAATTPQPEEPTSVKLPEVSWVSVRDGTRAPGDLEDQAARYHLARHELTVNADFRVFTDMAARWVRQYQGVPGAREAIEALVREWFEQTLVEVVLSARNLGNSPYWDDQDSVTLISPATLTAAVLPRQLVDAQIKKRLAQKLGR